MEISFYQQNIAAGFPSPADDYIEGKLDLNKYLITNPPATFFVKAACNSMIGSGIFKGDVLIVDRSKKALHNKIVIASYEGELIVRRLCKKATKTYLVSENSQYANIELNEDTSIWGIVIGIVRKL